MYVACQFVTAPSALSRQYIHALFTFAIAYAAQPLSFSHAIHLGFHLKAKTPRSAVSWSQKTVSSLPISSLSIPLTSAHKGSFRNLIPTSYNLPRSFYFMTQFNLPYTNLIVAIILYMFLFYFPVLYIVTRSRLTLSFCCFTGLLSHPVY